MKSKTFQYNQSSITSYYRSRPSNNYRTLDNMKFNLQSSGIRDITNTLNNNDRERSRSISRQEKNSRTIKGSSLLGVSQLNDRTLKGASKSKARIKRTTKSQLLQQEKVTCSNIDNLLIASHKDNNSCNQSNELPIESRFINEPLCSLKSLAPMEYFDDIEETLMQKDKILPIFEENFALTYKNRTVIVDWMIESFSTLEIQNETLFLAIHIFDDYIARFRHKVYSSNIALVAVSSLFIASKYEEIYPPDFEAKICKLNTSFSPKQIISFESYVLGDLGYNVCYLTIWQLLGLYSLKIRQGIFHSEFSLLCIRIILLNLNKFKKDKVSTLCLAIIYLSWRFQTKSCNLITENSQSIYSSRALGDSLFCKYVLFPVLNERLKDQKLQEIQECLSSTENSYFAMLKDIEEVTRQIIFAFKEMQYSEEMQLKSLPQINSSMINYHSLEFFNYKRLDECEIDKSLIEVECRIEAVVKSCLFSELIDSVESILDQFDLFSI